MFDYEAWERRKKASSWKKCSGRSFQSELISMFKTYGYDADFADRKNISVIYEDTECVRTAVYCKTYGYVKEEEVKLFLKAMERNGICKKAGIEIWNVNDILNFEKTIEEREE